MCFCRPGAFWKKLCCSLLRASCSPRRRAPVRLRGASRLCQETLQPGALGGCVADLWFLGGEPLGALWAEGQESWALEGEAR